MANSQNGWPVVAPGAIDKSPISGHTYPNGFREGNVYKAFVWLFTQMSTRVESVAIGSPADEWGYYVKMIEGSKTISNHASGTAGDYNATEHVMGVRNTYSPKQRDEIHKILDECDHLFRWGGDFTGRPDDMHFEIIKDEVAVDKFVASLEPQERYTMDIDLAGYKLPTLKTGDDDSKKAGYNYVHRAQHLLNYIQNAGLKEDGYYGELTEAAVNKLTKVSTGKTIGLTEWVILYGLSKS